MPRDPFAIGGFRARDDLQLNAEVAQNLFPEFREPETQFQAKRRVGMLPTRGHTQFDLVPHRVTALAGTRERVERLAVASGLELRVYGDPVLPEGGSPLRSQIATDGVSGTSDVVRVRPVHGACVLDPATWVNFFYTNIHGAARRRIEGIDQNLEADEPERLTLAGVAGTPAPAVIPPAEPGDPSPVDLGGVLPPGGVYGGRIWMSCAEDKIVRAWLFNAVAPDPLNPMAPRQSLIRDRHYDLDMGDTSCQMPESLYCIGTLPNAIEMAVVDAHGGDVYVFDWQASTARWRLLSQDGKGNTLSLQLGQYPAQLPAGTPLDRARRPAVPAGVHLSATEITLLDRNNRQSVVLSRSTGQVKSRTRLPAGFDGFDVCGFVGGAAAKTVVCLEDALDPDGRLEGYRHTARALSDGSVVAGPVFEYQALDYSRAPRSELVPLDDSARWMAWLVARKVHLLNLRENRLVQSVAVGVDSLSAADGRFVGCEASEGQLKVSPASAISISEPEARKSIAVGADPNVPGYPVLNPQDFEFVAVGATRIIVKFAGAGETRIYERNNLTNPFPQVAGTNILAVGTSDGPLTAGQLVVVTPSPGRTDTHVDVRWYPEFPVQEAHLAASRASRGMLRVPIVRQTQGTRRIVLTAVAASDEYLVLLGRFAGGAWSRVFRITRAAASSTYANVAALNTLHTAATWGPPADQGYNDVRAVDWSGGVLRAIIGSTQNDPAGERYPTIIRALAVNSQRTGYDRRPGDDIDAAGLVLTDGVGLAHDAKFLYQFEAKPQDFLLPDGTPSQAAPLVPLWLADPRRQSRFRWRDTLWQQDDSVAVYSIRGRLYSFGLTKLRIYQSAPENPGFPYSLVAQRDVGCSAPRSIALVEEMLYWIGASVGGGVRCWSLGVQSDQAPEPVVQHAVEEALDEIADDVATGIGWTDDNQGHPTYVVGFRVSGLTLAYDTHSKEWHTRTSLRLDADRPRNLQAGSVREYKPFGWQDAEQGQYRVEHSTQWQGRQFLGGYSSASGIIAEPSQSDWRDVDGGPVQRVRVFAGPDTERRVARFAWMRVDATYDHGDPSATTFAELDPVFDLDVSDDGGRSWRWFGRRGIGANRPPSRFTRLGLSRFRAYRIRCVDPIGFKVKAVIYGDPLVSSKG